MPIRFRRTLKIAPGVKLNFSKSGVSTTVGRKGLHLTFNKRGIRRTVAIPGTGVSEVDYIKKNETPAQKERKEQAEERREAKQQEQHSEKKDIHVHERRTVPVTGHAHPRAVSTGSTELRNAFVLLGIVVFFFAGAAMLGLMPANFLSNSMGYLAHLIQTTVH